MENNITTVLIIIGIILAIFLIVGLGLLIQSDNETSIYSAFPMSIIGAICVCIGLAPITIPVFIIDGIIKTRDLKKHKETVAKNPPIIISPPPTAVSRVQLFSSQTAKRNSQTK